MARVRAPVVGVGAVPVRGGGHLVGGGAARRGVGEVDACKRKKAKTNYLWENAPLGKEKKCIFSVRFRSFFLIEWMGGGTVKRSRDKTALSLIKSHPNKRR